MKSESRAARLLRLLQTLRAHRYPVKGKDLAAQLGVSLRTLYRDIAALQGQGARIDGAPGIGYLLRPGFLLPPLMLTAEEIEALVLGSRGVCRNADPDLQQAAADLMAKIETVLPSGLRQEMAYAGLRVGPARHVPVHSRDVAILRKAIRTGSKLRLRYRDLTGNETTRAVWPFALGYFEQALVLAAWCELRQGFRHFRTDCIVQLDALAEKYPRNRQTLLQEWQSEHGIPPLDAPPTLRPHRY